MNVVRNARGWRAVADQVPVLRDEIAAAIEGAGDLALVPIWLPLATVCRYWDVLVPAPAVTALPGGGAPIG